MLKRRTAPFATGFVLAALAGIVSLSCATGHADYVDPAVVVLKRLLPPPPAAGSPAERAELDEMLRIQAERTTAQADRAKDDATINIFRWSDALASPAEFTERKLPRVAALFDRINSAESAVVRPAKDYFDRPRPYAVEERLQPVLNPLSSRAYPSGHSTWAYAAGLVLADMVPERRSEILERSAEYARNRVVAGVHYPSDVEAGRISGSVLAAFLFASPEFRADEKLAASELRAALRLPPLR